jgi:eukaryotic-like serine/threonine-protein kinase
VTPQEIIDSAVTALGVESATPFIQGGQKFVLKATLSGSEVVVKIVPLSAGPAADVVRERARREVELLAAVDSDHVVKVLSESVEIGDRPDAIAWVEEYLDGNDLSQCMSIPWADDQVFRLLADCARGLQACHDLDVVHRDLSPGNVRQLGNGQYVLMDPGLARHLAKTALTGTYQPGTAGFRSPEHVPGGDPTPASDIYGLGILAFIARTGKFPIDPSGTDSEYFRRLVNDQARPVQDIEQSIGNDLAAVIDRCLQRQPARRYLDGAELLADLDKIGW